MLKLALIYKEIISAATFFKQLYNISYITPLLVFSLDYFLEHLQLKKWKKKNNANKNKTKVTLFCCAWTLSIYSAALEHNQLFTRIIHMILEKLYLHRRSPYLVKQFLLHLDNQLNKIRTTKITRTNEHLNIPNCMKDSWHNWAQLVAWSKSKTFLT